MACANITNTISPTIRRAKDSDAGQVISGINTICTEGGAFYTTRFVSTPQWEGVLHHPEAVSDHILAVAELQGEIIGAGRLFPGGPHTLMNHVTELGLFVLKPFRRQGIGSSLVDWLVDWAIEADLEKLTLTVFATNEPALRFFSKHHFIRSGRMQRQIKTADGYADLLIMERFLS